MSKGGERRDRKEKENRKGGLSYSYFIHTLTSLFKKKLGRGVCHLLPKSNGAQAPLAPTLSRPCNIYPCGYGVADVSNIAMFSHFDGTCVSDNFRLRLSAGYGGLNHMM